MHILFEYSGVLPVQKYGGTQRVLFYLMKELVKLGHKVSLIADPHSKVASIGVKLIAHPKTNWYHLIPNQTDLIHFMGTPQTLPDIPFVVTIHGNGKPNESFHENTIFISKKHAQNHQSKCFVYNGIDLDSYPLKPKSQKLEDFLFLAKASWKVKNLKDCVKACKKNKKRLHIAGGRSWSLSKNILSYGMIDEKRKIELLQKMDALLFPVRWEEPFGIALIEAMACGLPIFGTQNGSLPELIPTSCGMLFQSYEEFEQAICEKHHCFDSKEIRKWTEEHFHSKIMAREYLKKYTQVLDQEKLNTNRPMTKGDPSRLIDF